MTIRQYRKKWGLTLKQMGRMCGVTEGCISHYETGTRQPSKWRALKIEQVTLGAIDATSLNKDARL